MQTRAKSGYCFGERQIARFKGARAVQIPRVIHIFYLYAPNRLRDTHHRSIARPDVTKLAFTCLADTTRLRAHFAAQALRRESSRRITGLPCGGIPKSKARSGSSRTLILPHAENTASSCARRLPVPLLPNCGRFVGKQEVIRFPPVCPSS